METPHVFLDTEVFERNNFDFQSRSFKKLISLVQEGTAIVHLTQITRKEIEAHIVSRIDEALGILKKVSKERAVQHLSKLPAPPFQPIQRNLDPQPLRQAGQATFETFIIDARADVIPVDTVRINEVFDQYFGSMAPFHMASKKSEFPDAFALAAIRQWCQQTNNRIYVISNDKGFIDSCEGSNDLISLTTLDELLDLAARQAEQLYAFAIDLFEKFKGEILENLKEEFEGIFIYLDEAESDVSDTEVKEVDLEEVLAISVEPNEALFEISADVTFTVNYSYADYIVEDVIVSTEEGVLKRTTKVHAEVSLLFDQEDPDASQVHFVSIRENNLKIDLWPDASELK